MVTFYSLFSTDPTGLFKINVCMGTACYVQGAREIEEDFRRDLSLKNRDTSEDGLFTVKSTRCIGACGLAPVITVNGEVHGKLGRRDVPKILRNYRKKNEAGEKVYDQRPERPAAMYSSMSSGFIRPQCLRATLFWALKKCTCLMLIFFSPVAGSS